MERGRRARQWGACITPIASPATPVVGNLSPVPLALWIPLHLSPRHKDHPALAQAGVWRRLSCGPFSSGLVCLRGPGSWGDLLGPGEGGVRPGRSLLLATGKGCPSSPWLWDLCPGQGTDVSRLPGWGSWSQRCAFCLPGYGANIFFPTIYFLS